MNPLRMKNDTAMRKRFFHPDAMSHPAKLHGGLFLEIMERYTLPDETILDPMGGIGTALLSAMYGRSVILNEMESHFIEPMRKSWAKIQVNGPALGHTMGPVLILQGDARHLAIGSADSIVTSPPYADSQVAQSSDGEANRAFRDGDYKGDALKGMGLSKGYTRPVDAVVSSPSYANRLADTYVDDDPQRMSYTTDAAKIDAVVSSPPYEGDALETLKGHVLGYGTGSNIGNLKNDAYWEAMSGVYRECHRVLRPGGIMALIVKGFTRDGKYVDLPGQTQTLCETMGFVHFDTWLRELWNLSFWRILQQRRDPDAFDERLRYETVLAFRKEGQVSESLAQDIAAVVTSPPYEGSLQGDEPSNALFSTERRVNSPASGNRKSKRKPLGHGYTRPTETP